MKSNAGVILIIMLVGALVGGAGWLASKQSKAGAKVSRPQAEAQEPVPAEPPSIPATPAPAEPPREKAKAEKARPGKLWVKPSRQNTKAASKVEPVAPVAEKAPEIEVYQGPQRHMQTVQTTAPTSGVTVEVLKGSQRQDVLPPMPTKR